MALWGYKNGGGGRRSYLWFVCALLFLLLGLGNGCLILSGRGISKSFDAMEATFAPAVGESGESGILFSAEPLDACSPVSEVFNSSKSPFLLIIRGGCTFDDKIRNAQSAGFKAAIVYDNQDQDRLVSMAGTRDGINIPAVFISKSSGEVLQGYAGRLDLDLLLIPSYKGEAWSIMAISFISLLAMSSVLATCFCLQKHSVRHQRPRVSQVQEFSGMSSRLVKAMPSLIFTSALEDNCTSKTCAICLEDYCVGEKLRLLPCCHKFHATCVDSWLTTWRTFCPVCKQDAKISPGNPPASESTPLLCPLSASSPCVAALTSPSSVAASRAISIVPLPPQEPSSSHVRSLSSSHLFNQHISSTRISPLWSTSSPRYNVSRVSPCLPTFFRPHSLFSFSLD
ncbi:receptor homology region, transmembrane domain- and RING domain-containing protein 1-like [Typha angustifolia]|uniref:receptor homology region, transmembrane domain- and RING domain-containing protein 1-like n=1 Tax=Typha angustifolia TaxID=59011 RepID=UPI003C2B1248